MNDFIVSEISSHFPSLLALLFRLFVSFICCFVFVFSYLCFLIVALKIAVGGLLSSLTIGMQTLLTCCLRPFPCTSFLNDYTSCTTHILLWWSISSSLRGVFVPSCELDRLSSLRVFHSLHPFLSWLRLWSSIPLQLYVFVAFWMSPFIAMMICRPLQMRRTT